VWLEDDSGIASAVCRATLLACPTTRCVVSSSLP
jgi:hypothetical protein